MRRAAGVPSSRHEAYLVDPASSPNQPPARLHPDASSPGPSPDAATYDALVRALAACGDAQVAPPAVHEAVNAYVQTLKGAGAPPERVLVRVKSALELVGLLEHHGGRRPVLVDRVIGWSIEEYYRTT